MLILSCQQILAFDFFSSSLNSPLIYLRKKTQQRKCGPSWINSRWKPQGHSNFSWFYDILLNTRWATIYHTYYCFLNYYFFSLFLKTHFSFCTCREIWSFICINTLHYICCCILCFVWPSWWVVSLFCFDSSILNFAIWWLNIYCCFQLLWGYHFCNLQTWTQWGTSSSRVWLSSWVCPFLSISGNTPLLPFMVLLIQGLDGWVFPSQLIIC